ncbi:MAG: R3H domain-containing nucleic acid-binding protein [Cyanobacteria bacterium P01_D01_bin.73]
MGDSAAVDNSSLGPLARGPQWLEAALALMQMPATVTAEHDAIAGADSYWLTIDHTQLSPEQIEGLVGNGGVGLDALQHLANTGLNAHLAKDEQHGYVIELDGHRARQRETLGAIAQEALDQVRSTGEAYKASSGLSAAERKHLHSLLEPHADVTTHSEGVGADRHLVVSPVVASPDPGE